jgi:hypothetical protein
LLEALLRKATLGLLFQKLNITFHLFLDILYGVFMDLVVKKRGVEEEKRDVKSAGLNFVPLDHRSADIVTAHQKVRLGETSQRAFTGKGRSDIGQGVRAEVSGVSLVLGSLTKGNRHSEGSTHGTIIFRVERKDSHGIKRFHGTATRNPSHFLAKPSGMLHHKIIGHHQTTIRRRRFNLSIWINLECRLWHVFFPRSDEFGGFKSLTPNYELIPPNYLKLD